MRDIQFPETQYVKEATKKSQIYLHHTAGGSSADAVYDWWRTNKEKVATAFVISGMGEVVRGFDPKYWAFHLGLKESAFHSLGLKYQSLDKISVGIEICNWGQLTFKDRKYYSYTGREVHKNYVRTLDKPFKGFLHYYDYSPAQIESTRKILISLKETFGIPLDYNPDIWDINRRALTGAPGVYTHNCVRRDKNDVYPHPDLIEMLKSL
jgi:N-acetyl-anhydromuramyl-L-alanine amidase AmpD